MEQHDHKFKIFSCRNSHYLAEKIAKNLETTLGQSEVTVLATVNFNRHSPKVSGAQPSSSSSPLFLLQKIFLNCCL